MVIVLIGFAFFGAMIGSGSYGYVEQYKFNANKKQLINAIEDFKTKNKEFIPVAKYGATDSLDSITSQFFGYIYYSDEDVIVCFFIDNDSNQPNGSCINLLSVNEGLHKPEYRLVNKDFDRKENLEIKKKFEERFLNKLHLEYKDDGNPNFIFWK